MEEEKQHYLIMSVEPMKIPQNKVLKWLFWNVYWKVWKVWRNRLLAIFFHFLARKTKAAHDYLMGLAKD